MSQPKPPPDAQKGKRKLWRDIHRERKDQQKNYREENMLRKIEKQKKRDEIERLKKEDEIKEKTAPVVSTISIAVPGSILENAQSEELRTCLAGQIARAACIFKVDEVIVFDDIGVTDTKKARLELDTISAGDGTESVRHCCLQLARILQYLECPQYLRKFFFPMHRDLKFAGLLNPLDAPHHLRQQNEFIFREGVVSGKPPKQSKGSYVNIGLLNDCLVDKILTPGLRVTVKLQPDQDLRSRKVRGKIVSPLLPRRETGVYWGYTVRIAKSLSDIFTKSPYENGYDLTIGTSDKGESVQNVESSALRFEHALIVFGGVQGLEVALESDEHLDADDPSLLFDQYMNVVPGQGSRTIRTEEAILVALAALSSKFDPIHCPKEFDLSQCIPQSEDTGTKQLQFMEFASKRKRKHAKSHDTNQADERTISSSGIEDTEVTTTQPEADLNRFD